MKQSVSCSLYGVFKETPLHFTCTYAPNRIDDRIFELNRLSRLSLFLYCVLNEKNIQVLCFMKIKIYCVVRY